MSARAPAGARESLPALFALSKTSSQSRRCRNASRTAATMTGCSAASLFRQIERRREAPRNRPPALPPAPSAATRRARNRPRAGTRTRSRAAASLPTPPKPASACVSAAGLPDRSASRISASRWPGSVKFGLRRCGTFQMSGSAPGRARFARALAALRLARKSGALAGLRRPSCEQRHRATWPSRVLRLPTTIGVNDAALADPQGSHSRTRTGTMRRLLEPGSGPAPKDAAHSGSVKTRGEIVRREHRQHARRIPEPRGPFPRTKLAARPKSHA